MSLNTVFRFCLFLSVVLASDVMAQGAKEALTIYQTQTLEVKELHRLNRKEVEVIVIELDKVERLETELTRQADLAPNASESGDNKAIRERLNQVTLNALGRAWKEMFHAQQQGVDLKRLPAVSFRGKVYHQVHDIRSILKP